MHGMGSKKIIHTVYLWVLNDSQKKPDNFPKQRYQIQR